MLRKFLIALAGLGLLASITTHVDAGLLTVRIIEVDTSLSIDDQFNSYFSPDPSLYDSGNITGTNTALSVGVNHPDAPFVSVNVEATSTGQDNQPGLSNVTFGGEFSGSGARAFLITLFQEFTQPAATGDTWTLANSLDLVSVLSSGVSVAVRSFVIDDFGGTDATTFTPIDVTADGNPTTALFTRDGGNLFVANQILISTTDGGSFNVSASTAVVPEPTTLALWGAFGGLAFVGRGLRRRKTTA